MSGPFDDILTQLGEYRTGHLDISSKEFDDRVELHITDGLGNYSVVKVKIKDGAQLDPYTSQSTWVEIERYKPDQEEYNHPRQSLELFLFDVRAIDSELVKEEIEGETA